jgi:hypothetical protein
MHLQGIWLVGGKQSHADKLLEQHPHLKEHNPVLMPEAAMNKAFASGILDTPGSYPSTGFVGVQAALHCTPRTVKLHIFGFNWSKKTWAGHNVSSPPLPLFPQTPNYSLAWCSYYLV